MDQVIISETEFVVVTETGENSITIEHTGAQGPPGPSGTIADGDRGDVVVSGAGATWVIDPALLSTFMRAVTASANEAAFKAAVNLEIGTDVQAYNANLTTWAGKTPPAGTVADTAYVDSAINGLKWKQSVKVATTAAGALVSGFENGDTVDGVTLATGDRILIKNQAAGAENGIYVVAASGAPSRSVDADAGSELVQATVFVEQGTTNADTAWTCTNNAITLGSTSVAFAQFGAGASYAAGAGLSLVGTTFAVSDVELLALAGLTSAADRLPYFTGLGTASLATFTAAGRALVDDADTAAQRATLGLVIGTNVQAYDAELAAIAGLTSASDRLAYFTGLGTAALATFTAFGRTLAALADAAAGRAALGLTFAGARVHKNSVDQTLVVSTFDKVTFSTAEYDTASWFDNANDRLVVAVTGKYRVGGQVTYTTGIASGELCVARVLVNGAGRTRTNITSPGTVDVSVPVNDTLALVAGDYVELQAFKGGVANTKVYGSSNETFFNLTYLGS